MWKSLLGTIILEIKSADIGAALSELTKRNIAVFNLEFIDELTVKLSVSRLDFVRTQAALSGLGCQIRILGYTGIYWTIRGFLRRPVLMFGVLLYLVLVLIVPSRIFFLQVEGNDAVPDRLILEAAQQCGIGFGANRRELRSERIKNALLEKIPQLQWAAVNTQGCVAIISVRERREENAENKDLNRSVIATRDAIVRQITVLRGTPLCQIGQAVKAGQMLVSPYKDYGISIKLTGAQAKIYGETERKISAITPASVVTRTKEVRRECKYGLIFGKKQINFFKDSGIPDTSCVKMYEKRYLSFPGGFVLPVAWVRYTYIYYETDSCENEDYGFLEDASKAYIMNQTHGGTILQENSMLEQIDNICRFSATYCCYEEIGLTIDEEFINKNG